MKIVYIFIIILNIFLIIKSQILYLSYLPFNGPYTILVGTKKVINMNYILIKKFNIVFFMMLNIVIKN